MIKPGLFGKAVAADNRRMDFDFANEQILYMGKRTDVLFIGDSITQLWDLNTYFVTDKFLVNRGIGGETSEYLLKRFDADVIQLKPKFVVLMIGTNDISATHNDPWWRTKGVDKNTVINNTQNNIEAMVEKCRVNSVEIVLCSIIPSDVAPPYDKEIRWELTQRLNDFIKNLCTQHNIKYIDYHSKLCQSDGKTLIYDLSPDGIHTNAKGYEIMAKVLKDVIEI
jgi:lysophospholipase L1-like esterase